MSQTEQTTTLVMGSGFISSNPYVRRGSTAQLGEERLQRGRPSSTGHTGLGARTGLGNARHGLRGARGCFLSLPLLSLPLDLDHSLGQFLLVRRYEIHQPCHVARGNCSSGGLLRDGRQEGIIQGLGGDEVFLSLRILDFRVKLSCCLSRYKVNAKTLAKPNNEAVRIAPCARIANVVNITAKKFVGIVLASSSPAFDVHVERLLVVEVRLVDGNGPLVLLVQTGGENVLCLLYWKVEYG